MQTSLALINVIHVITYCAGCVSAKTRHRQDTPTPRAAGSVIFPTHTGLLYMNHLAFTQHTLHTYLIAHLETKHTIASTHNSNIFTALVWNRHCKLSPDPAHYNFMQWALEMLLWLESDYILKPQLQSERQLINFWAWLDELQHARATTWCEIIINKCEELLASVNCV